MVIYDPKDWFSLIFKFHKSDTFRRLFWVILAVAIYTTVVVYVELNYFKVVNSGFALMYQLLGFVISLLLVFRTNTAYDRWWEGRKQWGMLINVSRNLAIKTKAFVPKDHPNREQFIGLIGEYASVLRNHLRVGKTELNKSIEHVPNRIAGQMYKIFYNWESQKVISPEQFRVMDTELREFTNICGACERIKRSPIPYSYNIFIKKFIFVYVMTLPIGFVVDYGYGVVPITVFTLYALASLELIAEEIEDPFGNDSNDLPLDEMTLRIQKDVSDIT